MFLTPVILPVITQGTVFPLTPRSSVHDVCLSPQTYFRPTLHPSLLSGLPEQNF